MPFTKLKLTTFGQALETKWRQGKKVHFTRVAFGDGLLGEDLCHCGSEWGYSA